MAVDAQIWQSENTFRTALLDGDSGSRKALLKAYNGTFKAVTSDLLAIGAKIDAAVLAGEQVSASWLMQQQRYRDLQLDTAKYIGSLTTALGQSLPADMAAMARAGESLVGQVSGPVFNKLPASAIDGAVGMTATGSPLRTLLNSFNVSATTEASAFLRSRLVAGISLGYSGQRLATTLAGGVENLTLSRARTIARTETQRALRRATQLSISNNLDLVAGWVWRCAADDRTCPACWSLHGTFFPGSTPHRGHVNCRCLMIPKRKIKNDPYGFGNSVKVGNGQQLFNLMPEASQKRVLGPGRYQMYKDGKISFSDMRTLQNNAIWGPSYQVKSLKQIKADLTIVKVPKPVPLPKPLGEVVDPVPAIKPAPTATPKGMTAIQKAEAKLAKAESDLLKASEAETTWLADIPKAGTMQEVQAWIETREGMAIRMNVEDFNALYRYDRTMTAINGGYIGDGIYIARASFGGEYYWFRTSKYVSPWQVQTVFGTTGSMIARDRMMRLILNPVDAIKQLLTRSRLEKAVADQKIALTRLRANVTMETRTTSAIKPAEVTDAEFKAAHDAGVAVRDRLTTEANITKTWDEISDGGVGRLTARDYRAVNERFLPLESTSYQGTSLALDTATGRIWYVRKTAQFVEGQSVDFYTFRRMATLDQAEARLLYRQINVFEPSYTMFDISIADRLAISRFTEMQRSYTLWRDYQELTKISKGKSILDVPAGPAGESLPIPAGSTFAGKAQRMTKQDMGVADAERAKDWTSYRISERLSQNNDFIRSMVSNDGLGDWIAGAGRAVRPAVKEAADQWRGWTRVERDTFLRSGTRESGFNQWLSMGDTPTSGYRRGAYTTSTLTEGQAFIYDYTSQMVQQWAVTSGDAHILSVALQRAAMEEFNLQATTTLAHFEGRLHSGGFGVESGPLLSAAETFYVANGADLRLFLRGMYDVTQEQLAAAGIDAVRVVRGVHSMPVATADYIRATQDAAGGVTTIPGFPTGSPASFRGTVEGPVDLQPMSSFAVNTGTAKKFGGWLIYADVPSSWVIGMARTGFGCLNEYEWVVLGGPMKATVHYGRGY